MDAKILDAKVLRMFGDDYIKILTALLRKKDKKASGALINSLSSKIQQTAKDIVIIIESNDYLKYVDEGRKPDKYPPLNAISKWMALKNIPKEALFPIAKSIYKFGIKPTNVIQQTTKEFETSPTLTKKYEENIASFIEEELYKMLTAKIQNK
jgi:hypothetical protein